MCSEQMCGDDEYDDFYECSMFQRMMMNMVMVMMMMMREWSFLHGSVSCLNVMCNVKTTCTCVCVYLFMRVCEGIFVCACVGACI